MIREYLNNYYLMEQSIKECDEELEIIKAKLYASPAFDTSGIPKNPSPRNRIEDTYIDIIQRKEILTAQREEYMSIKQKVERYIDGISDLLTRRIFEKHILQKKTFKVIADELGGNNTESSVNKAYNRYIRDNPD